MAHVEGHALERCAALDAVRRDGLSLENVASVFRRDRELVLEAVRQNGLALKHAAAPLQADRELVLEAVKRDGLVLLDIDPSFLADRDIVLEAIRHDEVGMLLGEVADHLRADREIVSVAVQRYGHVLQDAAEDLRADKEIVLIAVQLDAWALQYAAPDLQADREIALEAVRQRPVLLSSLLKGFCADREVVLEAVRRHGLMLEHASEGLRADREVVTAAVRSRWEALSFAAELLRADRSVVLEAVWQNGLALEYATESVRADREVVLVAVAADGDAVQFAADFLRGDRKVMVTAVKSRSTAIQFARPPLKASDKRLLVEAKLAHRKPATAQLGWLVGLGRGLAGCCQPAARLHDLILSVRFSLHEKSSPLATRAHIHLENHDFFGTAYRVYDPNLRSKGFCGPRSDMTERSWPCRGHCSTIQHGFKNLSRCSCTSALALLCHRGGRPIDQICWRRSFMWHLQKARRSGGFMLQLEEPTANSIGDYCLGPGQEIEAEMAELARVKVFRLRIGRLCTFTSIYQVEVEHTEQMMNLLTEAVRQWRLDDCQDMSLVELKEQEDLLPNYLESIHPSPDFPRP